MTGRRGSPRLLLVLGAAVVTGLFGVGPLPEAAAAPIGPAPSCTATYTVESTTGFGFVGAVTLTNGSNGSPRLDSWELTWTFPAEGQRVVRGWGATWSQSGAVVTAHSLPTAEPLLPGQSVNLRFLGRFSTSNVQPWDFRLNGVLCNTTPGGAPVVALTSPRDFTYVQTTPVTISATAVDPDRTIHHVEFYANSTMVGSDAVPPYTMTWTPPRNDSGVRYTLTAVAYDSEGNSFTSPPVRACTCIIDPWAIETSPTLVVVPEGGSVPVSTSLYAPASGAVDVPLTITRTSGDTDISVSPETLVVRNGTPATVRVQAADDTESINNTAVFTVTGPDGWLPASIVVVEQDRTGPLLDLGTS